MGFLVIELMIGGILFAILTVLGLFFGHIILFESIALGLAAGLVAYNVFHIHMALCILIGLAVLLGMYFLQNTKVGFLIMGSLMSFIWAAAIGILVYDGTHKDMIWTWVVFGAVLVIMVGLHIHARSKQNILP